MEAGSFIYRCLETKIERNRRMGQCTNRDEINSGFCKFPNIIEVYTTGSFASKPVSNQMQSFFYLRGIEIIEHDAIHVTALQHFFYLIEVTCFDLDLEIFTFCLQIGICRMNCLSYSPAKINVIVL